MSPVIQSGTNETWAPSGAVFVTRRTMGRVAAFYRPAWANSVSARSRSQRSAQGGKISSAIFHRQFGRLRDIVEGPDKALYLLTSNRDGRGTPAPDDDRIIRLSIKLSAATAWLRFYPVWRFPCQY